MIIFISFINVQNKVRRLNSNTPVQKGTQASLLQ